ncbi:hypothetical protein K439DRAFT_1505949, partial [Ramaria rubella]
PFLVGTKFDTFLTFPQGKQEEITKQVKQFARTMHSHLSSARDLHQSMFKRSLRSSLQ